MPGPPIPDDAASLLDLELVVPLVNQVTNLTLPPPPLQERGRGLVSQVNNLISQGPELKFDIKANDAQTWQLNTYVDADTRVIRGDGGSCFIFIRNDFL